ncbi:hypothetical protein Tco_0376883, partial [Tanacetum coccineum]
MRPTSGIRATKGTLHKIELSLHDDAELSLHDDEELSLHDDASLDGSVPASNKGDAPVLQKDDYDTWAMEMEHYLEYIDNEV